MDLDVPTECYGFLTSYLVSTTSEEGIKILNNLFSEYMSGIQQPLPNFYQVKPELPPEISIPSVNFAFFKLKQIQSKIEQKNDAQIGVALGIVSKLIIVLSNSNQNETNLFFDSVSFENWIRLTTRIDRNLLKKIRSIEAYANQNKTVRRHPYITLHLFQNFVFTLSDSPENSEFYSPDILDDFFFQFLLSNDFFPKYDRLIKMLFHQQTVSFKKYLPKLNEFIKKQILHIDPKDKKIALILKCSILKVIFTRYFLKTPTLFSEDPEDDLILQKCLVLKTFTPVQFKISQSFILASQFHTPFFILLQRNSYLSLASNELFMLQFLTNPIDLVASIFRTLQFLEAFVASNLHEKKTGHPLVIELQDLAKYKTGLSFDDILSLFVPIFSCNPPSNPVSISKLFELIDGLQISPPFEFSSLIYSSTIHYLTNLQNPIFQ